MSRIPSFTPTSPLLPGATLIEASAGTGKTYQITNLVLRLVAEQELALDEILVVTFTKAATADLRGRIRERLSQAVRHTPDRAEFQRAIVTQRDGEYWAEITGNQVMARAIRAARERIMAGADIATPLRESKVVSTAVAHMIAVGERTGELESMLVTIGESIEEKTDISVQRISSVIEPIIIVVMALVVGFIVVATMLPILQVADISNLK